MRPELPDFGVYQHWPEPGEGWIHPDDRSLVVSWIPGPKVFKRTAWDGEYYTLEYGATKFRVKPSLWLKVQPVDLEIGQQVEVLSRFGKNDPGIYRIVDILLSGTTRQIEFWVQHLDLTLPHPFSRDDLQPVHVTHHLRQSEFTAVRQPDPTLD